MYKFKDISESEIAGGESKMNKSRGCYVKTATGLELFKGMDTFQGRCGVGGVGWGGGGGGRALTTQGCFCFLLNRSLL